MRGLSLLFFLLISLALLLPAPAAADLLITPKRLVLDSQSRDGIFRLVNTSDRAQSYELVWQQLRMNEMGTLDDMGENAAGAASRLLLLAPTRVTLQPGERQTVRLTPRLPEGLPEGEYMSHLLFRPVTPPPPPSSVTGQGAEMQLAVRVGFSIPVFLRHGNLSAQAAIRPIGIDANGVTVEMRREGTASIFGNLSMFWGQPGRDGLQVGRLDSVAIYANLTQRTVTVPFDPASGVTVGAGLLMVRYTDPDSNAVLAESTVRLE
ncbi:fimbrial biogenesis chaperone [Oceanibaculum indicum]|uniref:Uncharacterized protein n=1 Tax=Oceanibaculum indicum P24 TaxID=1207063 RepID=K2KGU1_9PROT|nr:fimbria/pilus periplasmic chaperone [Oceanibaculum indicum]EKE76535.1 hypothetical protein P24_07819 [Oceanibaculum indicum P24]